MHMRKFISTLIAKAKRMLSQVNPNHLEHEYRRLWNSPDAAAQDIGALLFTAYPDDLFKDIKIEHHRGIDLLVRVAVCGDELRANVFRLEAQPGGKKCNPFHDTWMQTGIVDFFVNGTTHKARHIDGLLRNELSYDPYEPIASYHRVLDEEELSWVREQTSSTMFYHRAVKPMHFQQVGTAATA